MNVHYMELLAPILERDARYAPQAYQFVREGLDYTVRKLDQQRHVTGQELLDGLREYALIEFGPVAKRVLAEWGVEICVDFGNIVFNLVNEQLLGKTDEDSIEDFMNGYDFNEAFLQPFSPREPACCPINP